MVCEMMQLQKRLMLLPIYTNKQSKKSNFTITLVESLILIISR